MSQEALEQFMTQVEGSADLQAQIGEEIEADALVALGAEHGCEFTVEDVRAGGTAESAGELSDEQLEPVAGGMLSVYTNVSSYHGGAGSGGRFRFRVSTGYQGPPIHSGFTSPTDGTTDFRGKGGIEQ